MPRVRSGFYSSGFSGLFAIDGTFGGVLNGWLMEAMIALVLLITLSLLNHRGKRHSGDGLPLFFLLYGTTQIVRYLASHTVLRV